MKKYTELYNYYKELIITRQLTSGEKLPSVRNAAALHGISKTTVQNAYFDLQADGYIISSPKSGYYVTDINISEKEKPEQSGKEEKIVYNFRSGEADEESFDLLLWRRYIKSAFRQKERLLSYGDVQGEYDLREALSDYIREKRNVISSPDRIVVGAGVQPLLSILCALIKDRKTVSFPNKSFSQGIALFSDYGYNVHIKDKNADIVYVCPSHMTSYGDVMPIKRRIELIAHSKSINSIIIEDDFDSDFAYSKKPTPSLFALSGGGNVVYMGSFSNVLIPGIRLSFMVLTNELAELFKKNKYKFAQTASKTEQIALCNYIRDGHIMSQTRKLRRHYTAKTKLLLNELKYEIETAEAVISDNSVVVKLKAPFNKSTDVFRKNGTDVYIEDYDGEEIKLVLSPSSIPTDEIHNAVLKLKECIM